MSITRDLLLALADTVERDADLQRRLRAVAVLLGVGGGAMADASNDIVRYEPVSAFAKRVSLSERAVWKLVHAGLPTIGSRRTRRIDIERAMQWLRDRREHVDDAVERDARQRARRAALRAVPGGQK